MSSPVRKGQKVSSDEFSVSSPKRTRSSSNHKTISHGNIADPLLHDAGCVGSPILDQAFSALGACDLLELDPRPTFVLNIQSITTGSFEPIFANKALRSDSILVGSLRRVFRLDSQEQIDSLPEFRLWLGSIPSRISKSFSHSGFTWSGFIVQDIFLVISGSQHTEFVITPAPKQPDALEPYDASSLNHNVPRRLANIRTSSHGSTTSDTAPSPTFITPGTPDWTAAQPVGDLSQHVIFARSINWAVTPLGDMSTWSPEFRQIANLLMANPHPAALFWGDELTVMYNKAYADTIAGNKHPKLMGAGFTTASAFQEIWDFVGPIFQEVQKTGLSVAVTEQMLPIGRHGFDEETFFTWSLTPLYGGTSNILGLYNAPFETTRQTRAARATQTLLKIGQETALAQNISEFWPNILKALEDNGFDFPFAVLYSVLDDVDGNEEDSSMSSDSYHEMKTCILEGSLGVPPGHPAAPTRLHLTRAQGGFLPSFRVAMQTREPKLLEAKDGSLTESLLEGIEWRGYGDPCHEAIVCPIRSTNGENVMGFLVIGVNPHRRFDEDYQSFIQLLDRQLATSLASVTLFEAERRRGQSAAEAAAKERSRLSEELAVQRSRLQRMAEISPVGMFSTDPQGCLLEANDRWYDITGHPRDTNDAMAWLLTIHEKSVETMENGWKRLAVDLMPWSAELRLTKSLYDHGTGEELENWVLAASQPEFSTDGKLKSIMGTITDISLQKRSADMRAMLSEQLLLREQEAKDLQKKQLEEAEENRRSQNNFIDITSHEMRNPLSAILQCADSISTSLKEALKEQTFDANTTSVFQGSIENAETILLCAQHQKSIVDDILTISKLDSNLLLITPMPVQPVDIVRKALKMFVAECQMAKIQMNFHVEESWQRLDIKTVMLDSSRLLQVMVNLMTNAIKFTRSEKRRTIDVSLSAYLEPPNGGPTGFQYFPTKKARSDVTAGEDWGRGIIVYIRFEVKDSGCGLTEEEMKTLFTRFAQASPKTHVKYGGSGLGLFISRQLTELQGGEIGVASKAGEGSTFAFYIKARRTEPQESVAIDAKANADLQSSTRVATDVSVTGGVAAQYVTGTLSPVLRSTVSADTDPKHWHVLIVEDNLVNQRVLAQGIRKLGCTVLVANHGGEALDRIKDSKYYKGGRNEGQELTVVLIDLEMPVMDGLTCVRKIRELEKDGMVDKHLPIIAVTANARGEQIVAAKNSGMVILPLPV
ncbi:hypothetical protein G7Y89_g6216 [Cudoniella acicularis]|uniref:Uncharacterized protein n=1 Tax=Cudoniella acicularis TaxID=354080 RepID=A0A8H4RLR0_9HELO|nr:hypothetical protein G7Y89_g6216 [Cudoniella acicularis]